MFGALRGEHVDVLYDTRPTADVAWRPSRPPSRNPGTETAGTEGNAWRTRCRAQERFRTKRSPAASDEVVGALARLVPQLSSSSDPPTSDEVAEMATSPATVLFVARDAEVGSSGRSPSRSSGSRRGCEPG